MWVAIIWINTQECKAGFLCEYFAFYELSLVSQSAWTTLMGCAAPWVSSLLFPYPLSKHLFSARAMHDHDYHELQALRPSTRVRRWGKRRRAGKEVVFHSWHRWQMRCASNAVFTPLPRWGNAMQRVLHQRGMWEGWHFLGISDPAGAQDTRGKEEQWGNELQLQQCSAAAQKRHLFFFTQLQAQCMTFFLLAVKWTEKQTNMRDFPVS